MFAAAKALKRFHVPSGRWVDVFRAIKDAEALMMFRPLGRMSGGYLCGEDIATGVLINANHPLSRQRMTAAHELGHLVFRHQSTVDIADDDFQLATKSGTDEEKLAESFARWFLMPHDLIDSSMLSLGVEELRTPVDLYRLSLYLGTSYEATARHVLNAKRASRARSQAWLKEKPITIKRELTSGVALADARSDVHVLYFHESNTFRLARVQDLFVLHLPERPATGYRWNLAPGAREHFEVMRDEYVNVPAEDDRTSAEVTRRFVLQARTVEFPLRTRLVLSNTRRWDPHEPVQTFELDVELETIERVGVAFAEENLVAA